MCMRLSKGATTRLRNRMLANGGRLTCLKVYHLRRGQLASPVFVRARSGIATAGWLPSNRKVQEAGKDAKDQHSYTPGIQHIYRGIHVLTSPTAAKEYASSWARQVIVPVQCHLKDLVAGGTLGEAVFTRVRLLRKDFNAAVKGNGNGQG